MFFKPAEGYRGGGRGGGAAPLPTFDYWFKDAPASPVTVEIRDAGGNVVYTATGQPGTGAAPKPPSVRAGAGGGRRCGRRRRSRWSWRRDAPAARRRCERGRSASRRRRTSARWRRARSWRVWRRRCGRTERASGAQHGDVESAARAALHGASEARHVGRRRRAGPEGRARHVYREAHRWDRGRRRRRSTSAPIRASSRR